MRWAGSVSCRDGATLVKLPCRRPALAGRTGAVAELCCGMLAAARSLDGLELTRRPEPKLPSSAEGCWQGFPLSCPVDRPRLRLLAACPDARQAPARWSRSSCRKSAQAGAWAELPGTSACPAARRALCRRCSCCCCCSAWSWPCCRIWHSRAACRADCPASSTSCSDTRTAGSRLSSLYRPACDATGSAWKHLPAQPADGDAHFPDVNSLGKHLLCVKCRQSALRRTRSLSHLRQSTL